MLASIFVVQGYQALRRPEQLAEAAEPVVQPLADRMSFLTDDPEQAVRINGAVHLVAGSLLAAGKLPRLSALALAVTLVPTTWAGHRFWETEDEQERAQQKIHFLKNLSMMGGLLAAAADTGARPSLVWRSRHALHDARHDVTLAARTARTTARATRGPAAVVVRGAGGAAKARRMPAEVTTRAGKAAGKAAKSAGKAEARMASRAAKAAARASEKAAKASRTAGKAAKAPAGLAARAGKKTGTAKGASAGLLSRARLDGRARTAPAWSGKVAKSAAKSSAKAGRASAGLAARGAETAGRAREASAVAAARAAQAAEKAARRSAATAGDVRKRLPVG